MDFIVRNIFVGFQVLILTYAILTSAEDSLPGVVTSQEDGGTCSYVLTVPKEPCKCDCIKEFQQMTTDYERRLSEVERVLLQIFDALPQADDYVDTQSSAFRLLQSMDSIPEFFPGDHFKPGHKEGKKPFTTPAPPKNEATEKVDVIEKTTSKPSSMTVKPYRADDQSGGDTRNQINLQMTAVVDETPQEIQVDGMSGTLVVPESSEVKVGESVPTVELPPSSDPVQEVTEEVDNLALLEPPAPNMPARKSEITSADIDELNKALKSPKVPKSRRPASPTNQESEEEEEVEEEEEISPPRPPPGFVSGMEKSAGFTGDFNRPQWKKLEEFLETTQPNKTVKRERPTGIEREPTCERDGCGCLVSKGRTQSGIYLLPNVPASGKRGVLVEYYCDLETNGGGWTVIQRRQNGSANFYRNWNHYAHGFGYLDSSFWIGNRLLHALTQRFNYELRIEFSDWDGKTGFAEYDRFHVGPEEGNFQLSLGKFRAGNRGNAFSYHNGTMFSTYDRDNDKSRGECAVLRQAGFWFKNCNRMNPNGRWIPFADATGLNGAVITWGTWSRHLYTYSMKDFRMMIRPTESSDFA